MIRNEYQLIDHYKRRIMYNRGYFRLDADNEKEKYSIYYIILYLLITRIKLIECVVRYK